LPAAPVACERPAGSEVHVAHAAHAAAAGHRGRRILLRTLGDHRLGGDQQAGDRRRVLEGATHDLHGVDDAGLDEIDVLAALGVEAPVVLVLLEDLADNDDQRVGIDIVRKALQYPTRLIAENAGTDGSIVVGKLLESKDHNWGFDAQANEYGDLVKKGIIDPTKVVRCALQDAASVAGLLITTEAMVAEKPEKKSQAGGPGGGMPGGGMGDMDF
jgi:hypothetical protein